jgi:hypothetical protein
MSATKRSRVFSISIFGESSNVTIAAVIVQWIDAPIVDLPVSRQAAVNLDGLSLSVLSKIRIS